MSNPTPIRVAQVLGITLSSFWGGATFGLSSFLVPAILSTPVPNMLSSWANMYNVGKKMGPPISIVVAVAYGYLAYQSTLTDVTYQAARTVVKSKSEADRDFWRYVAAALLSAAVAPYTGVFMMTTNNDLLARNAEVSANGLQATAGAEGASQLVEKWAGLNMVRAALLISSGVIGAWTALG